MIVKKSEIKELAGKDYRVAADFYDALDKKVAELVKIAKKRAGENGRKTLKPYDL